MTFSKTMRVDRRETYSRCTGKRTYGMSSCTSPDAENRASQRLNSSQPSLHGAGAVSLLLLYRGTMKSSRAPSRCIAASRQASKKKQNRWTHLVTLTGATSKSPEGKVFERFGCYNHDRLSGITLNLNYNRDMAHGSE